MKELLVRFSRFFLPLLGAGAVFSCIKVMYGCPHADFEAKGAVTDENGNGIKGIRVIVCEEPFDTDRNFYADTLWTGDNGEYGMTSEFISPRNEVFMKFEDIDGLDNGGEYETVEQPVQLVQVKEGDGSWYEGAYKAEANVTMTRKKE